MTAYSIIEGNNFFESIVGLFIFDLYKHKTKAKTIIESTPSFLFFILFLSNENKFNFSYFKIKISNELKSQNKNSLLKI